VSVRLREPIRDPDGNYEPEIFGAASYSWTSTSNRNLEQTPLPAITGKDSVKSVYFRDGAVDIEWQECLPFPEISGELRKSFINAEQHLIDATVDLTSLPFYKHYECGRELLKHMQVNKNDPQVVLNELEQHRRECFSQIDKALRWIVRTSASKSVFVESNDLLAEHDQAQPPQEQVISKDATESLSDIRVDLGVESSAANASENTKGAIAKRSTGKGEARVKLIAALTKHHEYEDGSCLITDFVGSNDLADLAGVSKGSAHNFFKWAFGGHKKYKVYCRDVASLSFQLKRIRDELSPAQEQELFHDAKEIAVKMAIAECEDK
jgi:hypothetical protein